MDEDPSEIDPEMAAFMGFASFGTQPAAKKRKYNHRTDAVSDSTGAYAPARAATGANQVALKPRAPRAPDPAPAPVAAANTDEIALDSGDEGANGAAAAAAAGEAEDQDEGGANLYSDPAVAPALAHAQELIDELAARGGVASSGPTGPAEGALDAPQAQGGGLLPPSSALPQRPDASWGREMGLPPTAMPTRERTEQQQQPSPGGYQPRGRHQPRDDGKPWWEGYYDPTFNENPWDRLEKKAGVKSRGTWVPRRAAQTQTA
ncbi:hypothetical protein EsH8_II_000682 [Colletotrichum jinshuiense]